MRLSEKERAELIGLLEIRFKANMARHADVEWADVKKRLETTHLPLGVLSKMEETGGEPDVIEHNKVLNVFTFADCSKETPAKRRSVCYDAEARLNRKKFPPAADAVSMAEEMGAELMTPEEYRQLQRLGEFDLKTSSWVKTPKDIRELGGALFCDRRYDTVFTYHNGADSYYKSRGFRLIVKI